MQVALSTVTSSSTVTHLKSLVNREHRSYLFKVFYRSWNAMKINKSLDRVKKFLWLVTPRNKTSSRYRSIDRKELQESLFSSSNDVYPMCSSSSSFFLSLSFPLIHEDEHAISTVTRLQQFRFVGEFRERWERFSGITGRGNISLKFFKGMEPSRHSRREFESSWHWSKYRSFPRDGRYVSLGECMLDRMHARPVVHAAAHVTCGLMRRVLSHEYESLMHER